jgi:alkylresorcinol/alkylpyrone synthase
MSQKPIRSARSEWKNNASGEQQSWLYMSTIENVTNPPSARAAATELGAAEARPLALPIVLSDFQTILMTEPRDQEELKGIQAHFMTLAQCARKGLTQPVDRERLASTIQERMARYGASSEHIARRQVSVLTSRFVVPAPDSPSESVRRYGALRASTGEALDERMRLFEEVACDVFERVYPDPASQPPDDIVHVSCSGYISPSPVQTFLSRRAWLRTGVTHSYHMGCYGAFPAVRTAVGLVGSSYDSLPKRKRRVDLVHTEFLSLHFDLLGDEPDNFVTSTLFADGFIKYSASPLTEFEKSGGRGLKVLAIDEYILPDSLPEMTLRPGPLQFDMSLSKRVPFMIRDSISDFVASICAQVDLDFEREKSAMTFAIHPGGPAILNQIRTKLGIEESQIALSRKVLKEHGNMASATAPHIWKLIVESPEVPVGSKILSMAFGPGLTVIGALFEKF